MNADDVRESLQRQPKPSLGPFFAARVAHQAASRDSERRKVPRLLVLYWVLFAFFAASLLMPTVVGVPLAILAAALAAFPERLARVVALFSR